jgi:hypothetical protein
MNIVKRMKRRALLAAISLGPSLAFTATDIGTLTVGHTAVLLPPSMAVCVLLLDGYASGHGSYSPTGLTGGKVVRGVYDTSTCAGAPMFARFEATTFSSDPGKNWLTSVTCNGVARLVGSSTYTYSAGQGTWAWSGLFGFPSLSPGTNVTCTIVHN